MRASRRARGQGGGADLPFVVNGSISRATLPRSPGLRPGDALVLTHPLSTGILLAADGRGLARVCWMQAALRHMTSSNQAAARVLAAHDASVAAYVADLRLLRHLAAMLTASGTAARLAPRQVPAFNSVHEMLAQGVTSPHMRTAAARHLVRDDGMTSLTLPLDPQVAGPLLAGVPAARADACVNALQAAGHPCAALMEIMTVRRDAEAPVLVETDPTHPTSMGSQAQILGKRGGAAQPAWCCEKASLIEASVSFGA